MTTTQPQEVWAAIVGYEGLYSVSNLGRVRSEPRKCRSGAGRERLVAGGIRKSYASKQLGYMMIGLSIAGMDKSQFVHALVLTAFMGPCPDGMECAHGDGDRENCTLSNLRWDTPRGNNADKYKHGTQQCGERHGNAKLTAAVVAMILSDKRPQSTIAKELGVRQSTISRIKHGVRWVHLTSKQS